MTEAQKELMIFDFSRPESVKDWHAIDDRIMGGCSQSYPEHRENIGLCFTGNVSLENNGGFASIRSAAEDYDLAGYHGLLLKVRGDGHQYKISLRTDCFFDGISYQAAFTTKDGEWQEILLPLSSLEPTHHGVPMKTVASLDASSIQSFGLFIADRQAGPFRLEIAWIKART